MREHFPDFGARGKIRPCPCRWLLLVAPWCGGKFVLLPKKFGKRGGVFRILMPTAPSRTKLSPALRVAYVLMWGWLGKSTPGFFEFLCWGVAGRRILPPAQRVRKD